MSAQLLIGRDHPAATLRAEIGRTAESHGGLVLVAGEAGIGKTTLVTGAADEARRGGALVLSGSCWHSDNAPGYWPWVQLLRALRRSGTPEEWAAATESSVAADGGLSVLLGETAAAEGTDAFRLYDAVTSALVAVSQSRPVVVVLDDLHWADPASLKLLEFVAQHTWFERVLLIGTYRDAEVEADEHPQRSLFAPLLAKARTVPLTGLEPKDVGRLLARTAGDEPDAALVSEVHRRTGGNPFFVEQTARLWKGGGEVTAIAPGVRDAVRRRLAALPRSVGELLSAASVLGRDFHRQVLAATVAAPVAQVDHLLEQAVVARLVETRGAGRFAFVHDLVRETLYDTLAEGERRVRHAAVVRALDGTPALAERIVPGALARHASLAAGELDGGRAAELMLAAAREACARMALEEGFGHYRKATELLERLDPRKHVLVSLELGRELEHHGSDPAEGWTVLTDAAIRARELGEAELLARAALTVYRTGKPSEHAELKAELIDEAHRTVVTAPDTGGPGSIDALSRELTLHLGARARQEGDDEALGFSLSTLHDTTWGLGTAAERTELTREMARVARRTGDLELEQYATSLRWVAMLERGDPGYDDQLRKFVALTERVPRTRMAVGALVDRSIIAALQGRFAEAERLFEQVVENDAHEEHQPFAAMVHHVHWARLLLQGRTDEAAELHASAGFAGHPFHRLLTAITAVERGDSTAALRYLADARATTFPRSIEALWLRFQAQAAAAVRDPELCARARDALRPYAGQWLVALFGCDVSGPVTHWLGILDAAERRWDAAIEWFTEAERASTEMGSPPWRFEAALGRAGALLGRATPGDAVEAAALLDATEREARELGMARVVARVERLRPTVSTVSTVSTASTVPGSENGHEAEFRFVDGVWQLTMDGHTIHMPGSKGLRDLHTLLSAPGTDVPAVHLLDPEGGELVVAARSMGGDDLLDAEAKAAYQRRLATLDGDIDDAEARGDDEQAATLDRERAALLHELRAAAGLGGRTRRLGDEAERARKTVTARIKDTLRKLDERHPALAEHLRAGVSTGANCRYQPEHEISWRLQ